MSKWINKDLFNEFQEQKKEERENENKGGFNRSDLLWDTPERGTTETPKTYEGRIIPDPKGKFYKKYMYHMWQSGDTWIFIICPKTDGHEIYCPFCSAQNKLWSSGTKQDKAQAYLIKRKEKYVGNWFVIKDPRDAEKDEEDKVEGKVKLYEFPGKVETKFKQEIIDPNQGYGMDIFDPGPDGRNFILKVLSTKKDDRGKTWPDYSNSLFSRTQEALGTDDEIKEILDSCKDLDEYIDSKRISNKQMIKILKNEFLWDLVESEAIQKGFASDDEKKEEKEEEDIDDSKWDEDEEIDSLLDEDLDKKEPEPEKKESKKKEPEPEPEKQEDDDEDLSDEDLLAELDDI